MAEPLLHRPIWAPATTHEPLALILREWLVTNGFGGYSSGTIGGVMTRKYHGYLIAALPAPFGRIVMLQNVLATVRFEDGREFSLSGEERSGRTLNVPSASLLRDFRLEMGMPVWEYAVNGLRIEKRVVMPYRQNTVHITYRLIEAADGACTLTLRPLIHFRPYEAPVTSPHPLPYRVTVESDRVEVHAPDGLPPVRLRVDSIGVGFTAAEEHLGEVVYRLEQQRGYESVGDVWSPGYFTVQLAGDSSRTLVASSESWDVVDALSPAHAWGLESGRRRDLVALADVPDDDSIAAELVIAADQFIITPVGRVEDAARAAAAGDEIRTVIAGYHWFTDWGRDTMISLEGLTLSTGRVREAGYILRTFAHYIRHGLIPNMFPDGQNEGLYHTADATLWFFHALHRYVERTGDEGTLRTIVPKLLDVVACHLEGTLFGIHVDSNDGLLVQGAEGYQLTWMDAKVEGWVVTPRRGKAVEINALWYNALRLTEGWLARLGDRAEAKRLAGYAARVYDSFNERFWYADGNHLYDVIDGEHEPADPACRPNQIFAVSLDHPVLERDRWPAVVETVRRELLTPVGLRSLSPRHPDYKKRYFGDLRTRDAAYHQGTVWAWLIGPFVDAWLKVHPEDLTGARRLLDGLVAHLDDFGVGSVAEVFDAEEPYTPRGCVAQAWSVAEMLRVWRLTGEPTRG